MLQIFHVYKKVQHQFVHERGPIVLGRGGVGRGAWQDLPRRTLRDATVSWDHLLIEEVPGSRVRLRNLSEKYPIKLATGAVLAPGAAGEAGLPIRLILGETLLQLERAPSDADTQSMQTLAVALGPSLAQSLGALAARHDEAIDLAMLTRWFEAVIALQRAAISTGDFFRQTAAAVELIGLDRGLVLLRREDGWEVFAPPDAAEDEGTDYAPAVLDRVCAERRTIYQDEAVVPSADSRRGGGAIVAAPVLAGAGDETVAGVVYGVREAPAGRRGGTIKPLEAQLVQVLAATIGAGLARLQSEADAARRKVQFEQFFSAELASELDRDPGLLEGRDREVTVLFCDIRGFSRISERLAPREVCRLASDVMDRLTDRVRDCHGTVVSYNGDSLMALWNAPADQPDHALLACRAALAMHAELPGLDALWQGRIGKPLALGIGLNTGQALVGNTGSRTKFMYGPQGHAVNLASRVEGTTKQLGVPILITGTTQAQLRGHFATRRLCRVRVVGIEGDVELYELAGETADPTWLFRREAYELGLEHFEEGRWIEACQTLYPILAGGKGAYDLPTLSLVGRCIDCLKAPGRPFDPVLDMDRK